MTPRQQARLDGHIYYVTGKPCKNDHVGLRYTSTGACLECLGVDQLSVSDQRVMTPRQQAKKRGDRIYYDGKPCLHGHAAGRYNSNGTCVQCALDGVHQQTQQRTQIRRDAARLAGHTFYRATRRCEHDHAVFHHVETDQCAECHAPAMTHDQLADYNLIRHKARPRPDNQHLICSWDDWRYWFAIYLLK